MEKKTRVTNRLKSKRGREQAVPADQASPLKYILFMHPYCDLKTFNRVFKQLCRLAAHVFCVRRIDGNGRNLQSNARVFRRRGEA